MENLKSVLAEHPFLKGMNDAQLELLAGCASNVVFKAGEFLVREGEAADKFFIIRQGKIRIETHAAPKGEIIICSLVAGEILGWSWLIPPYRWHFDARAVEVTRAIALDGKCLREKCEKDHDLGYEIMKRFARIIAERLEATRLQLMDIYGKNS